jgi:hypothetical protein
MLAKERKRLKDVDSFTMVDYIKTSIEILMNMRMEEYNQENDGGKGAKNKKKSIPGTGGASTTNH